MIRTILAVNILLGATGFAGGQSIDIEKLLTGIEERSGQYETLIEILQGTDATRSLAAFDAMIETGDPTMIEVAVNSGISATDSRLRARALWEALSRRDAFTIEVILDELPDDSETGLTEWYGSIQTWPLHDKFHESQCINLSTSQTCDGEKMVSVSGLVVDIRYQSAGQGIYGKFELAESGDLSGTVMDTRIKTTYPARIKFR